MGSLALIKQLFPPKSKFSANDIPDLTGQVSIITGANTGIGKETAKVLLAHNAKVYIASRSREKTEQAIKDLKAETGKEAIFLKLDLGDLKSVKTAADEFLSKETELHTLYNNAGVMNPPIDNLTAQGYDLTFGTNVLGHYYFTTLLIPSLHAAARSSPDGKARVVNVSSSGAYLTKTIDFDTVIDTPARKKLGSDLYTQSKFGNVVFSTELSKRYKDQGIVSIAVNPGNIQSELYRTLGRIATVAVNALVYPVSLGALTQLWAGTMPEGLKLSGKFLIPWAREGPIPRGSDDERLGENLWNWCEDQVKKL